MAWSDVTLFNNDSITGKYKPGSLREKNVDDTYHDEVKSEIAKRIRFQYQALYTSDLLDNITNTEVLLEPSLWYNSHLYAMNQAPNETSDLYKQGMYCLKMFEKELTIALSLIEFEETIAESSGLSSVRLVT